MDLLPVGQEMANLLQVKSCTVVWGFSKAVKVHHSDWDDLRVVGGGLSENMQSASGKGPSRIFIHWGSQCSRHAPKDLGVSTHQTAQQRRAAATRLNNW
jgi:hypothetical protein